MGSRGLGLVGEDHTQGRRKTTAGGDYSWGTHTPTPVGASGCSGCVDVVDEVDAVETSVNHYLRTWSSLGIERDFY